MAVMAAEPLAEQGQPVTQEQFRFVFVETDKKLAELAAQSKETDRKIAESNQRFAEQNKKFDKTQFVFVETDKKLAELAAQSKETDRKIAELTEQSKEQRKELDKIFAETAEQSKEQRKELDKIFAETAEQSKEQRKELDKIFAETAEQKKKFDQEYAERQKELDKKFAKLAEQAQETDKEFKKAWKSIKELSKNIGGISNTLGKWSEEMVAARLCEKVNVFGYEFTRCGRNIEYRENGERIAEVDCFLENGTVLMLVEVKTDLTKNEVDEYIEKVKMIRYLQDKRNDKRTIVAAMAGAIVSESVCKYAQKQGLYVLMQSGENIAIANPPAGFRPRKWNGLK